MIDNGTIASIHYLQCILACYITCDRIFLPIKGASQHWINQLLTIYHSVHITYFKACQYKMTDVVHYHQLISAGHCICWSEFFLGHFCIWFALVKQFLVSFRVKKRYGYFIVKTATPSPFSAKKWPLGRKAERKTMTNLLRKAETTCLFSAGRKRHDF